MTNNRLKKNKEFQYVYRRGRSVSEKHMVLIHIKARELKAGFSVSKRVGNSVVRNHTKRVMRESFRSIAEIVKPAKIVFVARESIVRATYWDVKACMESLLNKAGLLVQTNEQDSTKGSFSNHRIL